MEIGDIVQYKRQGSYGHFDAEVISVGKRVRIKVLSWCSQPLPKPYFANVKPRAIGIYKGK